MGRRGPAPDPGSLREAIRLEAGAIRTLPRERMGRAPAWPLTKATAREVVVWRALWKRPQAVIWEEQASELEVALHVRTVVEAEAPTAKASLRALVLQQQKALLLTHDALLRAGFRVATTQKAVSTASSTASRKGRNVPSARGRLRAVPPVGEDA